MQCRSHSRRRTIECLFVTACSMDEYGEEKRTEKNYTVYAVRSGISEVETTNNKRLRSTFCIEANSSYTDTKHRATSLRQQSFLYSPRPVLLLFLLSAGQKWATRFPDKREIWHGPKLSKFRSIFLILAINLPLGGHSFAHFFTKLSAFIRVLG